MKEYKKIAAGPILAVLSFILSFGSINNSFDFLIANSVYSFVEENADSEIIKGQFQDNTSVVPGFGGDDPNMDLSFSSDERFFCNVFYPVLCVREKLLSVYNLQLLNSVSRPKYYILYCSPKHFFI